MKNKFVLMFLMGILLSACSKDTTTNEPQLIIKIVLDSNQIRLGNNGTPTSIPNGNAALSPSFNAIAAHYLELAPNANTALGKGTIVYHAPETTLGGDNAIDFSKSILKKSGEVYLSIPLKNIAAGTYEWVRLSVSYQNYDVPFYYNGLPYQGTIASFVGYNSYINSFVVKNQTASINANKKQGFWAFESISGVKTGQSPEGATMVPNPLFATSPIPQGSCVVTGNFLNKLIINENETKDITVTMSLSINKSFEWTDTNGNGKWDVDNGSVENVVNMGLRGLIPSWTK